MNTPSAHAAPTLGGDDIHAFPRAPAAAPAPARRRRWPGLLLGLALLGLLLALALGSLAWHELHGPHGLAGVGEWQLGIGPDGWHGEGGLAGALAALLWGGLALLIVAVVLPLTLLGAGLAVGLALALGVLALVATLGLALGAAALVLLLLTSPLWLLGLLLWWALKPAAVASASSV